MHKEKKYEAQALAIAMVVLVVSSIIGLSLYSRTMKDKSMTFEERASAEALEISDYFLNKLTEVELEDLKNAMIIASGGVLADGFDYAAGITLREDSEDSEISSLFSGLGLLEGTEFDFGFCATDVNEYSLTLKEADFDTYYEVRAGQVVSFPIKGDIPGAGCSLDLRVAVRGDSNAGFSITKIYGKDYGTTPSYKEYDYDDVQNYCFSTGGVSCNNPNFTGANWIMYSPGSTIEDIPLDEVISGYNLDEIRVKAIGGSIGVAYSAIPGCADGFRMLQLRASATCEESYRGKEVIIPEKKWHSSIFDYVLFNGEGSI